MNPNLYDVHMCVGACLRASVRPSVRPSVRSSIRPSVRSSVRLSVRPSVRLSVHPCWFCSENDGDDDDCDDVVSDDHDDEDGEWGWWCRQGRGWYCEWKFIKKYWKPFVLGGLFLTVKNQANWWKLVMMTMILIVIVMVNNPLVDADADDDSGESFVGGWKKNYASCAFEASVRDRAWEKIASPTLSTSSMIFLSPSTMIF